VQRKKVNLATNLIILLIILVLGLLTITTVLNYFLIEELLSIMELDLQCTKEATEQIFSMWNVIKGLHPEAELEIVEYRILSQVIKLVR